MRILVTGGAGYIGSHTCRELNKQGLEPIAYDNLSSGRESAVRWGPLVRGDIQDVAHLMDCLKKYDIKGVIHLAASAEVAESVRDPQKYFHNNTEGTRSVVQAMAAVNLRPLVFSSTAAVYGAPAVKTIDELCPTRPINPYGDSKLRAETILREHASAGKIKCVVLRYFNAGGASSEGDIGEDHEPETHLIPLAIRAAQEDGYTLTVNGCDFPTPDGTCVRDYVHVSDLAEAHVRALHHLTRSTEPFQVFNLGAGQGASNLEIVRLVEKTLGRTVRRRFGSRREGDPAVLVASFERAQETLGWKPQRSLTDIVTSAIRWHLKNHRQALHEALTAAEGVSELTPKQEIQ